MRSLSRSTLYAVCSKISDDPEAKIKELADEMLERGFLEPREYTVLQHRVPLPGYDYKTLERIGKEHLSRNREGVRRIESTATRKMMGFIEIGEIDKEITLDTPISEVLKLPEINWKTRKRDGMAARVENFLIENCGRMSFETLGDLKNYIEENGWSSSPHYLGTRFKHFGIKSVEYFNSVLKKHGIGPLGPMYKEPGS